MHSLATVAEALEETQPFVMAGTALGAMRYQAVNPWEHDAELAMDTRHHWALVRKVVEQIAYPEISSIRRAKVRLDLAVRRGYSHKFYPFDWEAGFDGSRVSVFVEETPGTRSVYPHGDVIEIHVTDAWVGQTFGWKADVDNVFPLKKRLSVNGVLLYTPANLEQYVNDYFRSFYGLEEDFTRVCRGHRHAAGNTVDCADLDAVFPRVVTPQEHPRCALAVRDADLQETTSTCSLTTADIFYVSGSREDSVVIAWPQREEVPRYFGFVPPEEMNFSQTWSRGIWQYGILDS